MKKIDNLICNHLVKSTSGQLLTDAQKHDIQHQLINLKFWHNITEEYEISLTLDYIFVAFLDNEMLFHLYKSKSIIYGIGNKLIDIK